MNIVNAWSSRPFHPMTQLRHELERLVDGFFLGAKIEDSDRKYSISFKIPGTRKEHLRVEIENGQLVFSGERLWKSSKGLRSLVSARLYRKFRRTFPLPANTKLDQVEAVFQEGHLKITIPKSVLSTTTQIPIRDGKEAA
jgi:HSP20 family molecular chaperone IbpA